MASKNNKQTIRTMLTNKYFWAALILFRGILWIMGVTKGMGSEWAWYWISIYLSLLTLSLLGVGVLLVLVVFPIPSGEERRMTVCDNRFGCGCEVKPEPMPGINYFVRGVKLDKTTVSVNTKKEDE